MKTKLQLFTNVNRYNPINYYTTRIHTNLSIFIFFMIIIVAIFSVME